MKLQKFVYLTKSFPKIVKIPQPYQVHIDENYGLRYLAGGGGGTYFPTSFHKHTFHTKLACFNASSVF